MNYKLVRSRTGFFDKLELIRNATHFDRVSGGCAAALAFFDKLELIRNATHFDRVPGGCAAALAFFDKLEQIRNATHFDRVPGGTAMRRREARLEQADRINR